MTAMRTRRRLTVVFVLLVLLVVADRVAAWDAERVIAKRVTETRSATDATVAMPSVDVGGFPFLTQALRGRYQDVRIRTAEVITERRIPISDVDIRASGVRLPLRALLSGARLVEADQVQGTALMRYDAVAVALRRPNLQLSGENGAVRIRTTVMFAGVPLPVTGLLSVVVQGSFVRLEARDFTAAGIPVPQDTVEQMTQQLSRRFRLPELPYGLRLTGVEALSTGLRLTGAGEDVLLRR